MREIKWQLHKLFYTTKESDIDELFYKPRKRTYKTFGDKTIIPLSCVGFVDKFLLMFCPKTEVREKCKGITYIAYFRERRGIVYFIKESISKKTNPDMKISGIETLTRIFK